MKIPIVFLPLVAAGAMAAQTPAPSAQPPSNQAPNAAQHSARARRVGAVERLTKRLGLTADQQKQVRAFFQEARMQAKPLAAKMREERASLHQAVKSDSEQQIDQITRQNSDVLAQLQAIHMKAMAKVYSILTPEQKAKYDKAAAWSANGRNVG